LKNRSEISSRERELNINRLGFFSSNELEKSFKSYESINQ